MKLKNFLVVLLGLLLGVVTGEEPGYCQPPRIQVAASILPLGDFCRQIGGDRVEVQVLIPPGASPHTFEPSPGMIRDVTRAKVLVYVGAGLEPWLERLLKTMPGKKPAMVEATHGIALITEVSEHIPKVHSQGQHQQAKHSPETVHTHEHAAGNPHVWLDPRLAQDICRRIAAVFMQADSENRSVYEDNLKQYAEKLSTLDSEIAGAIAAFRLREFIGFHPSFTYFARRYNLKEVGIIEVSPGREPTPRAFQKIIAAMRQFGIKVIFSEPQFSPRIAEVLAKEEGAGVLLLDPIGGRPPYGDDYLKLMRYNLETMAKAMQ